MKPRIDWWLVTPSFFLLVISLVILRSIAPAQLIDQLVFSLIAIVVFVILSLIDYRIFFSLHLPLYVASVLFLITPLVFGIHSGGALRWLQFGQVSIQPSEIVKPFLLITFAMIATSKYFRRLPLLIISFLLPAGIIFFQPDLGTSLVLGIGWLTIFVSRLPSVKAALGLMFICLLILPSGWFFLKSYQKDRLLTFVNPYQDPLGRGYHVIQSITAVGSGQFWGRGLGHGTQSQLKFLPERHTDFIFASISEELGFFGSILVLALLFLFLHRIFRLSQTTTDPTAFFFCLACLSLLSFQVFINIGMNLGLAPVTGITLPFLSYGGSSLVSLAIITGLLHSISRFSFSNSPPFPII